MVEAPAELGVAIVNQQAQRLLAISKCHQQVARLLGCPGAGRVGVQATNSTLRLCSEMKKST